MIKTILSIALLLTTAALLAAQKDDDWWKMSDQKAATPSRTAEDAPVNAIKWSFPAPGQAPVEIGGNKLYQLTSEIFGMRVVVGPDKNIEAAAVIFTPRMLAVIQLAQIKDPADIPDLDRFLIWTAVHLVVKDPSNKGFHQYVGTNIMLGKLFYIYELRNGQRVGANISVDRQTVIIMPGPRP
jgi:hypothetical protein